MFSAFPLSFVAIFELFIVVVVVVVVIVAAVELFIIWMKNEWRAKWCRVVLSLSLSPSSSFAVARCRLTSTMIGCYVVAVVQTNGSLSSSLVQLFGTKFWRRRNTKTWHSFNPSLKLSSVRLQVRVFGIVFVSLSFKLVCSFCYMTDSSKDPRKLTFISIPTCSYSEIFFCPFVKFYLMVEFILTMGVYKL